MNNNILILLLSLLFNLHFLNLCFKILQIKTKSLEASSLPATTSQLLVDDDIVINHVKVWESW